MDRAMSWERLAAEIRADRRSGGGRLIEEKARARAEGAFVTAIDRMDSGPGVKDAAQHDTLHWPSNTDLEAATGWGVPTGYPILDHAASFLGEWLDPANGELKFDDAKGAPGYRAVVRAEIAAALVGTARRQLELCAAEAREAFDSEALATDPIVGLVVEAGRRLAGVAQLMAAIVAGRTDGPLRPCRGEADPRRVSPPAEQNRAGAPPAEQNRAPKADSGFGPASPVVAAIHWPYACAWNLFPYACSSKGCLEPSSRPEPCTRCGRPTLPRTSEYFRGWPVFQEAGAPAGGDCHGLSVADSATVPTLAQADAYGADPDPDPRGLTGHAVGCLPPNLGGCAVHCPRRHDAERVHAQRRKMDLLVAEAREEGKVEVLKWMIEGLRDMGEDDQGESER